MTEDFRWAKKELEGDERDRAVLLGVVLSNDSILIRSKDKPEIQ